MKTLGTYALVALCLFLLSPALHAQGDNDIDPKAPGWKYFPKVGEMIGATGTEWEGIGYIIHAIGDVNNDGLQDWILGRARGDTAFRAFSFDRNPIEIVLYYGKANSLPDMRDGVRIGVDEIGTETKFIASGDWDNDEHLDIVINVWEIGDTSAGNTEKGYKISRLIVFWGNAEGIYSTSDTTRLENGGDFWFTVSGGISVDVNHDGIEDILVEGGGTYKNGQPVPAPKLRLFTGNTGRWRSNDNYGRLPSWVWWNPPGSPRSTLDHDKDGFQDIFFYNATAEGTELNILYGTEGRTVPDTTDYETINILTVGGSSAVIGDVTGDGIEELVVTVGSENVILIYAGKRGQRIEDQFGDGYEDPHPERGEWWYRPWAQICMADKLNRGYFGSNSSFILADGNLDRRPDIWVFDDNLLLCYVAGEQLDSLIDGFMNFPAGGRPIVNIGDIDDSGIPTIAAHASTTVVEYYKPTRDLPFNGYFRKLPHVTSSVERSEQQKKSIAHLTVRPNPSTGETRIRWDISDGSNGELIITDGNGSDIFRKQLLEQSGFLNWNSNDVSSSTYFVTVRTATGNTTKQIIRY